MQDALGLYNDELTAIDAYREMASRDPRAWFGVGWLSARTEPNARACAKAMREFSGFRKFWD